jgi:uncharacterized protein YodC (DUF2158 family)
MAEQQFKVGDVVQANAGGPKMTVSSVGENFGEATVWCFWFDGSKKIEGTFPPAALKLAP